MHRVNLETWPRRKHFELFSAFDHPHFGLCANVDLTAFYPFVKQRGISFTVATMYVLARAANAIPEFRHRIRRGEVVEHEVVHPSATILVRDDLFSFCTVDYSEDFVVFATRAAERITQVQEQPILADEPGQDDLLFLSALPWVSFTSVMHPMHLSPADSIPRFVWGKRFEEGACLKMPLSVQAHHALMDGIHLGRFYTKVQDYLCEPEAVLGDSLV
ncbi:MAG: chloramphenicol acetyltransferase [Chloroflexales bacterium]|nr:chloramphenicol acetyltransferase [Chloroflexales bacterium]